METESNSIAGIGPVHHGRNIRYFRTKRNWSQQGLASAMGDSWTQRKISDLENMPLVEQQILRQVADALNVGAEWLETYNDELALHIYNNTFHGGSPALGNIKDNTFNTTTFDKVIEQLLEANKSLLENLLMAEKEKNKLLLEQVELLKKKG